MWGVILRMIDRSTSWGAENESKGGVIDLESPTELVLVCF